MCVCVWNGLCMSGCVDVACECGCLCVDVFVCVRAYVCMCTSASLCARVCIGDTHLSVLGQPSSEVPHSPDAWEEWEGHG